MVDEEGKKVKANPPKPEGTDTQPTVKPTEVKEGSPAPDVAKPSTPKTKEIPTREVKKPPVEKQRKRTDEKADSLRYPLPPLIFNKFDVSEIKVDDGGLARYINIEPIGVPHTGARYSNKWFGKTKVNIVERLINNMMRSQHTTGKKALTYRIVKEAFEIIAKKTKQNPVQVLVYALQNSSPKEEITRLKFGGISVPKAVDISSSRRLDIALRNISKGAVKASHKNKKRMEACLADEIILASKGDMNSFAVSKKEEMERIAASAR